jgi:hypothetical protein
MRKFILLACIILLSGCGTQGVANLDLMNQPIPSDKARVIVTRDNSLLYMAAAATVSVNGSKIASLGRGGSVVYDIPDGRNLVSVTTPMAFGNFSNSFEAKAKKTYSFEVSPRSEALMVGSAFGMLGDAVNASINENTGYFQIILKDIK